MPDTLIATNDTALFYLSGMEYADITLEAYPTPSLQIVNPRYRLPTKLEVSDLLRKVSLPDGYWKSKQRILCYDTPQNAGIKDGSPTFGTGNYYTFVPNGTITKAGFKTKYCILPIRSERIPNASTNMGVTINDKWDGQHKCILPQEHYYTNALLQNSTFSHTCICAFASMNTQTHVCGFMDLCIYYFVHGYTYTHKATYQLIYEYMHIAIYKAMHVYLWMCCLVCGCIARNTHIHSYTHEATNIYTQARINI